LGQKNDEIPDYRAKTAKKVADRIIINDLENNSFEEDNNPFTHN
jgi:hypothetical protein